MRNLPAILMTLIALWLLLVVSSALGFNPFNQSWDFSNTAQLGDSFGVVSSAMAGIAAYFAFATFQASKAESKLAEHRSAEVSYLNLIERRFDMLDRVVAEKTLFSISEIRTERLFGQEALDWAAELLWSKMSSDLSFDQKKKVYEDFIAKQISGLSNYHRFFYHLIDFARTQFSATTSTENMKKTDPSYKYVRLLRAQLSSSEMQLMAYNAMYGAGNPKLKNYIEEYALLNNMEDADLLELNLVSNFDIRAFGLLPTDRPAVVLKQLS